MSRRTATAAASLSAEEAKQVEHWENFSDGQLAVIETGENLLADCLELVAHIAGDTKRKHSSRRGSDDDKAEGGGAEGGGSGGERHVRDLVKHQFTAKRVELMAMDIYRYTIDVLMKGFEHGKAGKRTAHAGLKSHDPPITHEQLLEHEDMQWLIFLLHFNVLGPQIVGKIWKKGNWAAVFTHDKQLAKFRRDLTDIRKYFQSWVARQLKAGLFGDGKEYEAYRTLVEKNFSKSAQEPSGFDQRRFGENFRQIIKNLPTGSLRSGFRHATKGARAQGHLYQDALTRNQKLLFTAFLDDPTSGITSPEVKQDYREGFMYLEYGANMRNAIAKVKKIVEAYDAENRELLEKLRTMFISALSEKTVTPSSSTFFDEKPDHAMVHKAIAHAHERATDLDVASVKDDSDDTLQKHKDANPGEYPSKKTKPKSHKREMVSRLNSHHAHMERQREREETADEASGGGGGGGGTSVSARRAEIEAREASTGGGSSRKALQPRIVLQFL